ncbi:MAG TPA: CpaD family pilus assembly protein [Caulobacteraceae bacterium]|jgi:pilus assembly protein CpaD
MTRNIQLSVALAALAVSLTACAGAGGKSPEPITPTERYSMKAEQHPEQMAFGAHAEGLSDNQRSALVRYVDNWMNNGGGPIVVQTPKAGGDAASRTAWAVKAKLQQLGVGDEDIQVQGYDSDQAGAPVLIVYQAYAAVIPRCGKSWTNLQNNYKNEGYENFGCALTSNMAAQVANPRDIVTPAGTTPADAGRRSVVFDKYRKGEVTSAAQADPNAGKAATSVVN